MRMHGKVKTRFTLCEIITPKKAEPAAMIKKSRAAVV